MITLLLTWFKPVYNIIWNGEHFKNAIDLWIWSVEPETFSRNVARDITKFTENDTFKLN